MKLCELFAAEAKVAFQQLVNRSPHEQFCGFALFTDDSAAGFDVAANTQEHLQNSIQELRQSKYRAAEEFGLKWYTTEWKHEGGFANAFPKSDSAIRSIFQTHGIGARKEIFQSMIDGLKMLVDQEFFEPFNGQSPAIILVSVTDSAEDSSIMIQSLQELNPDDVYQDFLNEMENAGLQFSDLESD